MALPGLLLDPSCLECVPCDECDCDVWWDAETCTAHWECDAFAVQVRNDSTDAIISSQKSSFISRPTPGSVLAMWVCCNDPGFEPCDYVKIKTFEIPSYSSGACPDCCDQIEIDYVIVEGFEGCCELANGTWGMQQGKDWEFGNECEFCNAIDDSICLPVEVNSDLGSTTACGNLCFSFVDGDTTYWFRLRSVSIAGQYGRSIPDPNQARIFITLFFERYTQGMGGVCSRTPGLFSIQWLALLGCGYPGEVTFTDPSTNNLPTNPCTTDPKTVQIFYRPRP